MGSGRVVWGAAGLGLCSPHLISRYEHVRVINYSKTRFFLLRRLLFCESRDASKATLEDLQPGGRLLMDPSCDQKIAVIRKELWAWGSVYV